MANEVETKPSGKQMIPVEAGLFTMPDSPEGFHLLGSKCRVCETVSFPKKRRCIKCFSDQIDDVPLSDKGKVTTWTVIRMSPVGFKGTAPYTLAEVHVPEGPNILTQLDGIDPDNPNDPVR